MNEWVGLLGSVPPTVDVPDGEVSGIIAALLSVGAAAVIWTVARAWIALRQGAAGREKDAWKQIRDHNAYLDDTRRAAEADRDYYHSICNRYYGQLARAGLEPDPKVLQPPSERDAGRHTVRRPPPHKDPEPTELL